MKVTRLFSSILSESPVPLEFTPVLGILIGVVATMLAIAAAIFLLIRCKYTATTSGTRSSKPGGRRRRRKESGNPKERRVQLAVEEDDGIGEAEEEEDLCLKAQPSETETTLYFRDVV